ncbi:DUF7660 family protein [Flaviaesturariibacter amylovorans]|uniref:DUF7660 domain-containing protein n=1 Tax=Flaviaesturariibacter amylovorans TaxID=1084520 RepID=A0ABP8GBP5_9BACT
MNELVYEVNKIGNKNDFLKFVELLITDLRKNPSEWENKTLESYLEAIINWTEDMEGYYQNNDIPLPENISWKVFANILIAAKVYE